MGLFKKAMMTINSNYVFFMIMLLLLVQLTRFNFFSTSNDKFEKIPFDQLTYEKEKFVVPILIFGPNNQIQGFRESLFIAETLGRKVCKISIILHSVVLLVSVPPTRRERATKIPRNDQRG